MRLNPENPKELGYYLALGQVGIEMVVPVGIGVAIDHYTGVTAPWGVVVGAALGFIGGLVHLVVLTNKGQDGGRDGPPGVRRDPPG